MHGAAVTVAKMVDESEVDHDLIVATDMLDVAAFKGLCSSAANVPIALYMHENQLTYPFSKRDTDKLQGRDNHYGFINYTSCLAADRVFFNSSYHLNSFLKEVENMLARFPDHQERWTVDHLKAKSEVLSIGLDLKDMVGAPRSERDGHAVILWNHRWEHDKNPEEFFHALMELKEEGIAFELVVLGAAFKGTPEIFEIAKYKLSDRILNWGFCESRAEYQHFLQLSDILPVTSLHDFFGISVIEAMACGVTPLLPNRLAYPEHLDEGQAANHIYDSGEFKERVRNMIIEHNQSAKRYKNKKVEQYDWRIKAPEYDAVFRDLVRG